MRDLIKMLCLVAILSTILIPSTSDSKVKDIKDIESCLCNCKQFPDYKNWMLIEEVTLRALNRDASSYEIAMRHLYDSQSDLEHTVIRLNRIESKLIESEKRVAELEYPPWYDQPIIWGVTGLGIGLSLAAAIILSHN